MEYKKGTENKVVDVLSKKKKRKWEHLDVDNIPNHGMGGKIKDNLCRTYVQLQAHKK